MKKEKKIHLHRLSFICTLKVRRTNRSNKLLRRIKVIQEIVFYNYGPQKLSRPKLIGPKRRYLTFVFIAFTSK